MRVVRFVTAIGITLAFVLTSLAGGPAGPVSAPPPADGPIALLDTWAASPAGFLAGGAKVLQDYGNGYLLVRLPTGMRSTLADPRGVNWLADRTTIDVYFSGIRFDTAAAEPAFPEALRAQTDGAYLLQFLGPITPSWIQSLERAGLTFQQPLANFAYVVTGSPSAIAAARASPFVGWTGAYHPGYKVAPDLLRRTGSVAVSVIGLASVSPATLAAQVALAGGRIQVLWNQPSTVIANVPAAELAVIARLPEVLVIQEYFQAFPLDKIVGQIQHNAMAWDTRRSGLPTTLTGRSPGPDGVMYTSDDYFEGAGIMDTGFDECTTGTCDRGPLDFFNSTNGDRVTRFKDQTFQSVPDGRAGGTSHGTHVAGIIASDGYAWEKYLIDNLTDASVSTTDKDWSKSEAGIAPEAKINVDGVAAGGGLNTNAAYWDCEYANGYITTMITGLTQATCGNPWFDPSNIVTHNAGIDGGSRAWFVVNSNSWGSGSTSYNAFAAAADSRIASAPDRLVVFAAGNGGPNLNTVSGEALLKNGLTIGASDNFRPDQFESDNPNLIAGFSSRGGPFESNGRIKPDLLAIGTSVISLFGRGETLNINYVPGGADLIPYVDKFCSNPVPNPPGPRYCPNGDGISDYRYLQGTSMATPDAAGSALLVREYLREVAARNDPASPYFNPASYLVKAVMINGAVRMDPNLYTYPGYDQGWGRIDLQQSLFPPVPRTNQFQTGWVNTTGGVWTPTTINLNVKASDVPLKVSLVWLDATGDLLSRDIDLRVISPGGNEYHGDQYTNGWSDPTNSNYDHTNNVEQVEVQAPEPGIWTVQVRGFSVPSPTPFALVFSANVGPTAQYKVDVSTTASTTLTLAPLGSAVLPLTVLNYGTGADIIQLNASAPTGLSVQFYPTDTVTLNSTKSEDVLAMVSANASVAPGVYPFDIRAVSTVDPSPTPASDFVAARVQVVTSRLPYPIQVTNGTVDELDPSVLTFDSFAGRHIFIAYRKTSPISADGLTGGVNVWIAHATVDPTTGQPGPFTQMVVSNTNDQPNDLRLVRMTKGTVADRIAITWTGSDPAETDPNLQSWARIAWLNPPYGGPWNVTTIEKNQGTGNPCNVARVSFPLYRQAGASGELMYVWETLGYGGCPGGNPLAVTTSAKTSNDGGATWSAATQVFPPPGNFNFYFFPNGVVDQNDVAWIFAYWRTSSGNVRKITVRLYDNNGWSSFPVTDYTIVNVGDNAQWPAALSTAEGGNRVYVTFTRDSGTSFLRMNTTYATGTYSSSVIPADYRDPGGTPCGPGCTLSADFSPPTGSGLKGPFGTRVSNANYNRRPILNIVRTDDGITWLPYLENANAYDTSNLATYSSSDAFASPASLTMLTTDAFGNGHQMSSTLTEGGTSRVYEVYHSSHGTVTQVNYDVYLVIYWGGWQSSADNLGPLVTSSAGTPNPVNRTSTFRLTANLNDVTTGNSTIAAAEYFLDTAGAPGTGTAMSVADGTFDSPTEAVYADVDVGLLGWAEGECHNFLVRGQDSVGNWGALDAVRECADRGAVDETPPGAPILDDARFGVTGSDVSLSWSAAADEGTSGGTTRYRVYRATGLAGSFTQIAEINATGSATYSWTDTGAGDGNPNLYLYRVRSADAAGNEAQAVALGGKFTRSLSGGWNLVSAPVVQVDPSVASTFQTLTFNRARTYVASDSGDRWKAWIAGKPYNDFTTVDPSSAVWINVLAADSFTVVGLVPVGLTINLVQGWNFVGYPSWRSTPYTVANLKAAVPAVTAVEGYNALGPYYLRRMADTDALQQGYGYWLYARSAATWVVP